LLLQQQCHSSVQLAFTLRRHIPVALTQGVATLVALIAHDTASISVNITAIVRAETAVGAGVDALEQIAESPSVSGRVLA
jgi:hypothetical protein